MSTSILTPPNYFSQNLKNLLTREKMTQKELANKLDMVESTISGYMNGKLPNCEFLLKLKSLFPDISLDSLLTGEIPSTPITMSNSFESSLSSNLKKFEGIYYTYYLDTSKKMKSYELPSSDGLLKTGLIYVYKDKFYPNSYETSCVAILGIKNRTYIQSIRKDIEKYTSISISDTLQYLEKHHKMHLYYGTLKITQTHIFISLDHGNKDKALLIFHHVETNKPKYLGGLGTINSASTGRPSDPVIQFIGISRNKLILSDEEIQNHLLLHNPQIQLEENTDEIIRLIEELYQKNTDDTMTKYIPAIIRSNLELLIRKNIQDNNLLYSKIPSDADDHWYHVLKNCTEQNKQNTKGEKSETIISDSSRPYRIN